VNMFWAKHPNGREMLCRRDGMRYAVVKMRKSDADFWVNDLLNSGVECFAEEYARGWYRVVKGNKPS